MSIFSVHAGGQIIVLRTASDKNRLESTVNRFIKTLESLLVLKENIGKIKDRELINKEKTKDETRKAIKLFKIIKRAIVFKIRGSMV